MKTSQDGDARQSATAPIVVGIDGSDAATLAVRWAAETAAERERELRIVHALDFDAERSVVGSYDLMVPGVVDHLGRNGMQMVVLARSIAHDVDPDLRVSAEVSTANPAQLLIDYSPTAHMVVLGAYGTHTAVPHFGSTLVAVTRHASGTVVVVREVEDEQQIRHVGPVVLGVDGSPDGENAIGVAFDEAAHRGAELVAVHCWSDLYFGEFAGTPNATLPVPDLDTAEQAILAERLAGWQEKYPEVTVTRKVYVAEPSGHLMQWSHTAQLVVVGSRGRGGFTSLLLGSTGNFLVQHAHCPVMIVHPEPVHSH